MSGDPKQTLTARHAGSTSPNQRTTGDSSTGEDVEKGAENSTEDKSPLSFFQRARGKHLKHMPTIKQSLFAVLTQSCTFSSALHLGLGHFG